MIKASTQPDVRKVIYGIKPKKEIRRRSLINSGEGTSQFDAMA